MRDIRCAQDNNWKPATSALRPVIGVAILYYLKELDKFARYIDHERVFGLSIHRQPGSRGYLR